MPGAIQGTYRVPAVVRGGEILIFLSIFKVRYPWPPGLAHREPAHP